VLEVAGVATDMTTCEEIGMTTQAGIVDNEREFVLRCVGDAYQVLDLIPGVDPNGPALVWLAEQFRQLRRQGENVA
jgi:hypothetical protein